MLNRKTKQDLYFKNLNRCRAGRKDHGGATVDADPETRFFGTVPFISGAVSERGREREVQPASIPESTAWWIRMQKDRAERA